MNATEEKGQTTKSHAQGAEQERNLRPVSDPRKRRF